MYYLFTELIYNMLQILLWDKYTYLGLDLYFSSFNRISPGIHHYNKGSGAQHVNPDETDIRLYSDAH